MRSYCVGAAHQALGWVHGEGVAVDDSGAPLDLTIRSFGVRTARQTPPIHVTALPDAGPPVNVSDAVFAAAAAAFCRRRACPRPGRWPRAVHDQPHARVEQDEDAIMTTMTGMPDPGGTR